MVEAALTSSPVWRAKQAWLCIGVTQLIVAATVMASLLLNLNTAAMSSSARAGLGVITSGLVLWIGIQFSEVSSAREFQQRFGVVACRSEYIAMGIFAGMILQLGPRALVVGGLGNLHTPQLDWRAAAYLIRAALAVTLWIGFIYPAFRGSYSKGVSVSLTVAPVLLTVPEAHRSISGALAVATAVILMCEFRDRSSSIWPAIALGTTYTFFVLASSGI